MGSEQSQRGSLQDDPVLSSPTAQSETKAQSKVQASGKTSQKATPKFSPKDYGPPPPLLGDKPYQTPKHKFHLSVDYSDHGWKNPRPGKDKVGTPIIHRRSPTTADGVDLTRSAQLTQSAAPAKDPPPLAKEAPAEDTAKRALEKDAPPTGPPPKDPTPNEPPPKEPQPEADLPLKDSPAEDPPPQPRQQSAANTPTPIELTKEYFERVQNDHFLDVKERIEDIKNRPALNSDFDNLAAEVHTLLEMVSKEEIPGILPLMLMASKKFLRIDLDSTSTATNSSIVLRELSNSFTIFLS